MRPKMLDIGAGRVYDCHEVVKGGGHDLERRDDSTGGGAQVGA